MVGGFDDVVEGTASLATWCGMMTVAWHGVTIKPWVAVDVVGWLVAVGMDSNWVVGC